MEKGFKKYTIIVACFILISALVLILYFENNTDQFDFVLSYGVKNSNEAFAEGRNRIDTLSNKFTKDMIQNEDVTIDMTLTDEEMKEILTEMKRINIFNYPDVFVEVTNSGRIPHSTYRFYISYKGATKVVYWDDGQSSESTKAINLRNLIKKITEIIRNKEEYKALPKPKGGYM